MTSIGPGLPNAAAVLPRRAADVALRPSTSDATRATAAADDGPRLSRLGQPRPGLAHAVFTYGANLADSGPGAGSRGSRIDLYV